MNISLMYGISVILFVIGIFLVVINPLSLENIMLGMVLFSISILLAFFTVHFPKNLQTVELRVIKEKEKIKGRKAKKRKRR